MTTQSRIKGFEALIDDEALANRHRPRRLSEVVGQAEVTKVLMAQNRSGKRHHRVKLFSGPSGCGKTTIARALAAFELCEDPDLELGDACGKCEMCLSVIDGRRAHPDVHEHDASSNTSRKEDVERLVSRFDIVPMQGDVQVFILDEAHGLSRQAEDALLTHIENLASHNRVYLLTTEPESVPSTIRGRAQHFRLGLPSSGEIAEFLLEIADREGWDLDRETADVVVEMSPDSEGVRQAVTNLSKLAVLLEDSEEVTPAVAAALLGSVDSAAAESILEALTSRDPRLLLDRLSSARSAVAAKDLYRSLVREMRRRWRQAVEDGHDPSVFSELCSEILDALRSEEYTDFLVELALVRAAKPLTGSSPSLAEYAVETKPDFDVEPSPDVPAVEAAEADAAPVAETSPTESPAESPAQGDSAPELLEEVLDHLAAVSQKPTVVAAIMQNASVYRKGSALVIQLPSEALASRLSDARYRASLSKAATAVGADDVQIEAA